MVREYVHLKFGPNASRSDMTDKIRETLAGMEKEMFNARPLPENPTVLTCVPESGPQGDAKLWENTCPVCRPIVRGLYIFCLPQQKTFQDQNIFIRWKVTFSELASVLATTEPSGKHSEIDDKVSETGGRLDVKQEEGQAGMEEQENGWASLTEDRNEGAYSEKLKEERSNDDGKKFCQFCAYFACMMFDDPGYMFFLFSDSIGDLELDCCCMESMAGSKRVEKVARKLMGYAEKWGPDAGIDFLIQPIDYNLEYRSFGKIRFQAASATTEMSQEDLLDVFGLRRELVLEVYNVPGQIIPAIGHWPISTDPKSWPEYGKEWVSHCMLNHDNCQPPIKVPLPSRVVEIIDDDSIRIVSGADKPEDFYITLSYCWGGSQELTLTEDNLPKRQDGFSTSQLPGTLRDAVSVTKALGIRYIWIDSLCIIQDSTVDKQKELPRMAGYYRNSFLTIVASTSKCTARFLTSEGLCKDHSGNRIPKDLVPFRLMSEIEVAGQEGNENNSPITTATKTVIEDILVRKERPYLLSMEAIYRRGWTFQERVLSPRILHFGGRLVWQCHSTQQTAGGVTSWNDDAVNIDHRMLGHVLFNFQKQRSLLHGPVGADSIDEELYGFWYKAVEEYTRRDLGVPTDKLPAISALAQVFRDLMAGDEYLAGIWRGDFLRGLLWSTYPTLTLSRPPSWRAPTWSWASHDNEVTYKQMPPRNSIPIARVLVSEMVPLSNTAPLGEIDSGILEIEGPVLEIDSIVTSYLMQKENELSGVQDTPEWRYQLLIGADSKNNQTDPGCRDWVPPEGHIFLVLLATPIRTLPTALPSSSQPRTASEASSQKDPADDYQEQLEEANAAKIETSATDSVPEPQDPAGTHVTPSSLSKIDGYTLSGLILGPVSLDDQSSEVKYERLARFVSLTTKDYKPLGLRNRKVVIV